MNVSEIEDFRKMLAQLEGLHQEMVSAAKKSPDKAVSSFKIKLINEILQQVTKVLGASSPAIGFSTFDADDLPTASDVSFIVTQFVECAEKVRCENIGRMHNGVWHWKVGGSFTTLVTSAPKGSR